MLGQRNVEAERHRFQAQAEELAACKSKLAEVVDEVLYFESEVAAKGRQVGFLRQALADNTAAHGYVIESLNKLCVVAKGKRGNGQVLRKAENAVNMAMDDLRNFQQSLQRSLVDAKLQLPTPAFVRSRIHFTQEEESMIQRLASEGPQDMSTPSENGGSVWHSNRDREALALLEQERAEWKTKSSEYIRRINDLEDELHRAKSAQVWPFKDDHRSLYDGFGMSSNTVDSSRQVNTLHLQNSPRTNNAGEDNENTRLRGEVDRLKQLLTDQEREHDKQRKALMSQTEAELQDAETQIIDLRREVNLLQHQNNSQIASPRSGAKYKVNSLRISRTGEVDLDLNMNGHGSGVQEKGGFSSRSWSPSISSRRRQDSSGGENSLRENSMIVQEAGGSSGEQLQATLRRVTKLEEQVVQERNEKERFRRQAEAALKEKTAATEALESLELEHGIGREEFETERTRRQALRAELEKAHRDREVISREYKAAEKRHQAVMEEMKEVLEERDNALAAAQATNRKYLAGIQQLEKAQLDLSVAQSEQKTLAEQYEKAEREKQNIMRSLEAEKRNRDSLGQDLIILQQQKETIIMERDAAIREQQSAMRRVDDALRDRKAALETKDRALATIRDLQGEISQAKIQKQRDEQSIKSLESALEQIEAKMEEANVSASLAEKNLAEALTLTDRAKEEKVNAEQEMEVAQRQCRALTEELKSVLRVRDIALQQRDAAVAHQRQLTDAAASPRHSLLGSPSAGFQQDSASGSHRELATQLRESRKNEQDASKQCKILWTKVDELESGLAAVQEEKRELQVLVEQLQSSARTMHGTDKSYDVELFGLSNEAVELHKQRLVSISQRLAEVHQSLRANCIAAQSALPTEEPLPFADHKSINSPRGGHLDGLGHLRGSAVSTATKGQDLSEIFLTLSKQVQALDSDGSKFSRVMQSLIESARKATKLADRLRAETSIVSSAAENVTQMKEEVELLRTANEKLREELENANVEATAVKVQLDEAKALQRQASERVKYLQDQLNDERPDLHDNGAAAAHVQCEYEIESLQSKLKHLELTLDTKRQLSEDQLRRLRNEIEEERLQLKDALDRLKVSDDKVLELKRKLRTTLVDMERLEEERNRLSSYVEDASSQLRGVAAQKTHATKELEELYTSLTELETQLLASRAENARLKSQLSSGSSRRRRQSTMSSVDDNASHAASMGSRNVRIDRTGSIIID